MAQLVKLEPGDVLVLANVGKDQAEALRESWDSVREALGVEHVLVFEGDIDLSKIPNPEAAKFVRVYLNGRLAAQEAAWRRGANLDDGRA